MTNPVAMVIFAHPDDAEFGCAGTIAKWVHEGWDVVYVVCTDASGGGPDEAHDVGPAARRAIIETRQAEQRAACDILGVKELVFLHYQDGTLQPTLELRRDLVRVMRQYRPTRLICYSPERSWKPTLMIGRYHPDHLAAGQAALAAVYPACQNPWDFPELLDEGFLPHKVREIFIMASPEPNFPVDISDTLEIKLKALRAHVSQVGNRPELEERITGWARDIGERYELPLAEVFHRTENP